MDTADDFANGRLAPLDSKKELKALHRLICKTHWVLIFNPVHKS